MNEQENIISLWEIALRSLNLVKKHFALYFVSLIYLVVGGVIYLTAAGILLLFAYGISLFSMIGAGGFKEALESLLMGFLWMFLILILLATGFVSGYIGGLGHMLKGILTSDRINLNDFRKGVFRVGPRLFGGMVIMLILLFLPFYWGTGRLLHLYGVYDFATMQSGWNTALRLNMEKSHNWVVWLTYGTDLIIVVLLSFWWIITINDGRNFIVSFVKSIRFFFRNPADSLKVSLGCLIVMVVIVWIFGALWKLADWSPESGRLFGVFLILPVLILIMLQFYDRSLKPEPANPSSPLE